MNLGLRPSNLEFIYEASSLLKRDLLYFDQIHLCTYNNVKAFDDLKDLDPAYADKILVQFEYLKKYGLLCDFNLSEVIQFTTEESGFMEGKLNKQDHEDMVKIFKSFYQIPKAEIEKNIKKNSSPKRIQKAIYEYIEAVNLKENETTRVASAFLNRFAAKDNAVAISQNEMSIVSKGFHASNVLEVILEKLPVPNEDVEWRQIIEYRADPDSSQKFTALRVWMQDIARKDYSKNEIEDRIEHLINEYENHLKLHKLKFESCKASIMVTTPLEILENLVKFKWSQIGKALFSFKEKQFDLMEAEMNAPGKEVAYILKANEKFG